MAATSRQQPGGSATKPTTAAATVFSVAVASRVATVSLMVLANALLPTHDAGGVHKFRPRTFPVPAGPVGVDGRDGGALSAFTRWDAAWFLSIADSGYPSPSSGGRCGHGDTAVDCRGTSRAWGGEDYEHDPGEPGGQQGDEGEGQRGGREGEGHQEFLLTSSAGRRPPCLPDIPLEEQAHAFFPLYPWVVRWAAAALRVLLLSIGSTLGEATSLVVAAVLVSNACFVGAALLLHRLGAAVTGDSLLAYRGAIAFCVTPASVFFSTAYTESLYAALTFGGLLVLFSEGERRRRRRGRKKPEGASSTGSGGGDPSALSQKAKGNGTPWVTGGGAGSGSATGSWWSGAMSSWAAAALLSLATLTRSNGIAGAGVLVLERLRWMTSDAGLFVGADSPDGSAAARTRQAAPPTAGGSSPVATRSRSKQVRSRGDFASDGVGTGAGGSGTAAAAAAASSSSEAWSRWDSAVLCLRLAASLLATALQALLVVAPYLLVQAYAYRKFCVWGTGQDDGSSHDEEGGSGSPAAQDLRLHVEGLHPWCAWRVPSVYAHVQSAYWDVGALKYYQWKQVPNFLLAAPALALTARGAFRFFYAQLSSSPPAAAAARATAGVGEGSGGGDPARQRRSATMMRLCPGWLERLLGVFFGRPRLPHPASSPLERTGAAALVAQWAFLAAFAALCMNVQVATRFLAAACPPLHWWTASLFSGGEDGGRCSGAWKGSAVTAEEGSDGAPGVRNGLRWYLGVYFVVGAVLHANFLPWT
eukprot:g19741.t1